MPQYRVALRADFQETYGLDLHELWRTRQMRRILDLIDGLPTHARLYQALAMDTEVARQVVDEEERRGVPVQDEKPVVQVVDMTPEARRLVNVEALLIELAALMTGQVTGKKRKTTSPAVPKTAVQAERERRYHAKQRAVLAQWVPWDAPDGASPHER